MFVVFIVTSIFSFDWMALFTWALNWD